MDLQVEWGKPIRLRSGKRKGLIYSLDLDVLPRSPGIYIFVRQWGKTYEALYIGKTNDLRSRIKNHLNNLRLMRHIEYAKNGHRYLIVGHCITKRGQRIEKALELLERGYLRYFLSEGHDLVNQQGVRIQRHTIESDGSVPKAFIPRTVYLEKANKK
jgi:predicted GIY-YIG superfamily endonuclease